MIQFDHATALWLRSTEADLLASDRAYYQAKLAEVSGLLAEPPLRESYEVSIQVDLNEQGMARIRGI